GGSERHAITVVLKNHLESIGNAPLILNDEDFVLLFVATFRHDFRLAIVMPSIKIYNGHKKAHKAHKIILCFLCLLWLDWSGSKGFRALLRSWWVQFGSRLRRRLAIQKFSSSGTAAAGGS